MSKKNKVIIFQTKKSTIFPIIPMKAIEYKSPIFLKFYSKFLNIKRMIFPRVEGNMSKHQS